MPASCLMLLHAARRLALGPLLASALLVFPLPALAAEPTQITVSGTGTVAIQADMAIVNATLQTHDATNAAAATGQNEATYERVVAAVTALGIARSNITLSFYNVSYFPRRDNLVEPDYGFTVNRSFAIKVRQIALAGRVVDAAVAAGATSINGVTFGAQNSSVAMNKAMALAVSDATQRGRALAHDAGLRVVGIGSIIFGSAYTPGPLVRPAAVLSDMYNVAPATTFDAGNTTVNVTVTMVFLAKP